MNAKEKIESEDLELRELDNYFSTETYHRVFLNTIATDGVIYIMQNGYSWFVTDAISVIKYKFVREAFLTAELRVNKENSTADMVITDGDGHIMYRQHYKYTDAKRDLTLYYTGKVIMLSGEY